MDQIKLQSPAKINLFLRILGRRPDGYHNLSSLFQAIDLHDSLFFEKSSQDSFTTSDPTLPLDQKNLALKALTLFRKKLGQSFPVSIHLEKRIPMEAGLGGGSSNAATVLFGLNQLAGSPVQEEDLAAWGSEIGSDVAFFFSLGTALCSGRGEKVENIELPPQRSYTICKPAKGLSTPLVYQALDLSELAKQEPDFLLSEFLSNRPIYLNDLEQAAFRAHPPLAEFKRSLLLHGYESVLLSGSGSSFVCIGEGHPLPKVPFAAFAKPLFRKKGFWY